IRISDANKIRAIRLERPEKRNALTDEMYDAVSNALDDASQSEDIAVVTIGAVGDFFCAGNDLSTFAKAAEGPRRGDQPSAAARFVKTISAFQRPLIAAVNGPGVGVGATMLLHCDLVVARRTAWFAFPFADLGLVPEAGSSLLLPLRMGHAAAARLLLLGERLTAEEAHAAGLVSHIVDDDADAIAHATAIKLASMSVFSLIETKRLMSSASGGVAEHMEREGKAFSAALRSDFAKARFAAFLTKS
uniref:enoyl-CoA hydratase-related protein n=1 Tax=Blastomonas sp. UPD001 TaxID=2217673 RepID=UPI001300B8A7